MVFDQRAGQDRLCYAYSAARPNQNAPTETAEVSGESTAITTARPLGDRLALGQADHRPLLPAGEKVPEGRTRVGC